MEQPQNQLVYWDKHRVPVNITLFFALAVAAFGIYSGPEWILVAAGIGVAAYSWFTNPRRYMIYQDALTLVYGTPRVRVIYFANISRLEMRTLNTPDRLRVWLTNGRRVVLMARDPDAFHEQLQRAFDEFGRLNPEYGALTQVEEHPTDSQESLAESQEQPTDSLDQPAESQEQPTDSLDQPAESQERPTDSLDQPAEDADGQNSSSPTNRPPDFT